MEISRARFLLLASALAASACTVKEKDDEPKGSGGQSSGGRGSGGSSGSGGVEAGPGGSGGTAEAGAPDSGTPDSSVDPEAGTDSGTGTDGGEGGACDDSTGTPADCDLVSSAESCGLLAFQSGWCTSASDSMKPGIAARVTTCITSQTELQLCDSTNTYACVDSALKGACPDPTADTWCDGIIANCPDADPVECRTYLSGLSDAGRDSIYSCMESDCFGLYSCVESL